MRNGFLPLAIASLLLASAAQAAGGKPRDIDEIVVPASLPKLETSGVTYLADQKAYLVASDQTDGDDSPWLFLMNELGQMEGSPVVIEGMGPMADMESVSQDGGFVYVMSSQGVTTFGKEKTERNQFVRARRLGRRLTLDKRVELRPSLLAALEASSDPVLRGLRGKFRKKMDVESHFVLNGELFVGLKDPQPEGGEALIVALGDVDEIFSAGRVKSARVWRQISFRAFGNKTATLSDMLLEGGRLILTSSTSGGNGALWSYEIASGTLKRHEEFKARPEGVARDGRDGKLMLVFDKTFGTPLFARRALP